MPCAVSLTMIGDGDPPTNVYRILHANLLKWIAAASSDVADVLHERPVRKPFTLAGLRADRETGAWRWRITLLGDRLLEPLLAGGRSVGVLDLNGSEVPVAWSDIRVRTKQYDDLVSEATEARYLNVRFVSPTTFRQGRLDLPLPEPGAVFHSWLSRWNDFAPPHLRMSTELLDVVHEHVAVARIGQLHTQRHDLGRSSPVGFVGAVTFAITRARRLSRVDVRRLNALVDYAEFCGTGRKTTQGMGQTRRA